MEDIYSPPEADISVDLEPVKPTFLRSLGGFLLSLLAVNVLILAAGYVHSWLYVASTAELSYIAFGFLRLGIHVAWIIAWPMYCRRRGWPNLYRGARWHRLLFIGVVSAGVVVLLGIGLYG